MTKTDEYLKLSCEITTAELTINGLMKLSASLDGDDIPLVAEPLRLAIWGSKDETAEVPVNIAITGDDAGGHWMEINHSPAHDGQETFLSLGLSYPEPFDHIPVTMNFSRDQLARLWVRGRSALIAEERKLAVIAAASPTDPQAARAAKTLQLVRTILQYVAGEAPTDSPVTVFQEWLRSAGRKGSVGMVKQLPLAA